MSEKAEAFGQAMAEAAEAVAKIAGCDIGTASVALIGLYTEYARQEFGAEDFRDVVRMKSVEENQKDVEALRDALIRKMLPKPPGRKWFRRNR